MPVVGAIAAGNCVLIKVIQFAYDVRIIYCTLINANMHSTYTYIAF